MKQANHSDENIPYVEHSQQIFSIIPRDVLCLIFSYLSAEDLRSVFQVNKQFAATAGLYLRTIRDRIIKEYHNPRKLNLLPLGVRVPQPSSVIKTWLSELPSEVESVLRSRLSQIVAMPTLTAFALPHELHLFEKDPSAPDIEDSQPEDKE